MKLVGGLALAAMILLLAACGQTGEQADPFVGTWLYEGSSSDHGLIIAKHDNGDRATMFRGDLNNGRALYTRQNDRLVGRFVPRFAVWSDQVGEVKHITIEFDSSRGDLTFGEDDYPSRRFVRAATPGAWPSVWPSPDEEPPDWED